MDIVILAVCFYNCVTAYFRIFIFLPLSLIQSRCFRIFPHCNKTVFTNSSFNHQPVLVLYLIHSVPSNLLYIDSSPYMTKKLSLLYESKRVITITLSVQVSTLNMSFLVVTLNVNILVVSINVSILFLTLHL